MQSAKNQLIFWQLGLLIVAAFYLAARLWRLADSCLVFDEIFSVHAATHSWDSLFQFVAADLIHPPLFYVLLKIWILAGGESLVWLRLFPVLWAVMAIVPFFLLCRELKLKTGEIITAFILIATNGALIRYAQEVRMYSLLFCLSLFSIWLFTGFINRLPAVVNNLTEDGVRFPARTLYALAFVNLLLVHTHYFGWLIVLAQLIVWSFLFRGFSNVFKRSEDRKSVVAYLISIAILVLCFVPWAIWIVREAVRTSDGLKQNLGWAAKPGLINISQFILILNEPFYYQQSSIDAANAWAIALPMTLIAIGALVFLFLSRQKTENFILLSILAFAPVAAAFIASWILPYSVWGARHLIITFAPFAILISVALWRLPRRELKFAALGLVGLLIFTGGISHFTRKPQTFIWCGWGELAAEADAQTVEPTTIYVFEDDGAYQLWYALRNNPKFRVVSVDGYADMPEDKAYFLPRRFDEIKVADKTAIANAELRNEKFYLAFRETSWKPDKQVLRELTARRYKIETPLEFRAQGITAFLVPAQKISE